MHPPAEAESTGARVGLGHVSISNLSVVFAGASARRAAIEDFSLEITSGEFVSVLGPSGCGKSTMLNAVAGFVAPTLGSISVDDDPIVAPGADRGMVFQHATLFPWKTVLDNVAFGPLMAGMSPTGAKATARTFLGLVGLSQFEQQYPSQLSGGMQQRVGIARALANYPRVLLMDEPFGALDAQTRVLMQEALLRVWAEFKTTVIFITHDIDEAIFLGDRVVVMSAGPGRIIADLEVGIERPRKPDTLFSERFAFMKRQCFEMIRIETMRSFEQQGIALPSRR